MLQGYITYSPDRNDSMTEMKELNHSKESMNKALLNICLRVAFFAQHVNCLFIGQCLLPILCLFNHRALLPLLPNFPY